MIPLEQIDAFYHPIAKTQNYMMRVHQCHRQTARLTNS